MSEKTLDCWAIVELYGHQKIAGKISEQSLAGGTMLRVDVPATPDQPEFTKFFGSGAIYALTPTTEVLARVAIDNLAVRPVDLWTVPTPKLGREPRLVAPTYEDVRETDLGEMFECARCKEAYPDDPGLCIWPISGRAPQSDPKRPLCEDCYLEELRDEEALEGRTT